VRISLSQGSVLSREYFPSSYCCCFGCFCSTGFGCYLVLQKWTKILWCKCWSLKYFLCWSRHGKYNTNIYFCANPVWCCSLNVACSVCCYKQAFVFWGHIAYTQCICIDVAFCYTSHVACYMLGTAGTGELCKMAEPMGSRLVWAQKPYIILGGWVQIHP